MTQSRSGWSVGIMGRIAPEDRRVTGRVQDRLRELMASQLYSAHDLANVFAMTTSDEFAFIAQQLEWLEQHVRNLPPAKEAARLEGALNALTCARAVIVELSTIGRDAAGPALAEAA